MNKIQKQQYFNKKAMAKNNFIQFFQAVTQTGVLPRPPGWSCLFPREVSFVNLKMLLPVTKIKAYDIGSNTLL